MPQIPIKLQQLIDELEAVQDREMRSEFLIELAERFHSVPERISTRPFPKSALTPGCLSEAYVWAEPFPDDTLKFHFAVENPQGISAMAMAVILDETLSHAPLEEVTAVDGDIVYSIFGRGISMGKGQGLMGMVFLVQALAKSRKAQLVQS